MPHRLLEQFEAHSRQQPTAPALATVAPACAAECVFTYAHLHESVLKCAASLRQVAPPGSVVLLCAPNQPQLMIAFLAVLAANLTVFPVHPGLSVVELRSLAERSDARVFIGPQARFSVWAEPVLRCIDIDRIGQDGAIQLGARRPPPDNAGLLLQTSGSTGAPKIASRSGRSIDAVAANVVEATCLSRDDRVLAAMPLCHSYGVENGILGPILAGACVHMADGFDPASIARHLAERGVTVFPGVPFMFQVLVERGGSIAMAALRLAYSAGSPLPGPIADGFHARYGVRIGQLYGSTEVGSVTFSDPTHPTFDPASVGRAMSGVRILILDPDDPQVDQPLPMGREGLVAIAAPSMLDRYVDDPAAAMVGGYFHTGDLGCLDASGNLFITGRIKLQIDVGGLKVNPLEVEQVLAQHPAVKECVVVPAPATCTVDRLKAIVTLRGESGGVASEELRQFARARLASYKVPRLFEVRESLPKSPAGKILREALQCA